jgi:hypothetical protein
MSGSSISSAFRCVAVRFVPALKRLPVALREGRTTSDLDEEGIGAGARKGGEADLLREVAGRVFPFLKNGTLTWSVVDIVVDEVRLHPELNSLLEL